MGRVLPETIPASSAVLPCRIGYPTRIQGIVAQVDARPAYAAIPPTTLTARIVKEVVLEFLVPQTQS